MRNYSGAFQRTGEISREPRKRSEWLEDFAEKLAIEDQAKRGTEEQPEKEQVKTGRAPVTAVEVARQRQHDQPSIFEMMSAIVSGKQPKYSSVEEAVKDYQQRTGLTQYLQSKAEDKTGLDDAAQQIVEAGLMTEQGIDDLETILKLVRENPDFNDIGEGVSVWAHDPEVALVRNEPYGENPVRYGNSGWLVWTKDIPKDTSTLEPIRIPGPSGLMRERGIDDLETILKLVRENPDFDDIGEGVSVWAHDSDVALVRNEPYGENPVRYGNSGWLVWTKDIPDMGGNKTDFGDEDYAKDDDDPKAEDKPEEWLAKIVELFGNGPDDDGPGSGGGGTRPTLFEVPEEEEEEEWEEAATDDFPGSLDEYMLDDEERVRKILSGSEAEQIEFLKMVLREEPGDIEIDDDVLLALLTEHGASEKVRKAAEKIENMYGLDYPTHAEFEEDYTPREDYEPPRERERMRLDWEEEEAACADCAERGPVELFASAFKDLTEKKV